LNCCVNPRAIGALDGEIEMEEMDAVTVRLVLPETPELAALIVAVPGPTALASPEDSMVATLILLELHVTDVVILAVLPSLYEPVAVYWTVVPASALVFEGVTAIDCSVIAVTLSEVDAVGAPVKAALIVVVPAFAVVARPLPSIVAMDLEEEDQVTNLVRSLELPSLRSPVAVNWTAFLATTLGAVGDTVIEVTRAFLMVSEAVPLIPLTVALMVTTPADLPVANPLWLTVAIVDLLVDQVAVVVRSRFEPSL
jgi:hypothetical protein